MTPRRLIGAVPLTTLASEFIRIREEAGVVEEFSAGVTQEVEQARSRALLEDGRIDRTDLELVTIDPEGSKDLDQALLLNEYESGWRVYYAIADVAAHVDPASTLARDTFERAVTVYSPDKRVGLHPAELSEGFASLLPLQRVKAVLWQIDVAEDGSTTDISVERAWVKSRHQYSYQELASNPPEQAKELVRNLAAFGAARRHFIAANGGVSLPKPAQEIDVHDGAVDLAFRVPDGIEDDNAQVSLLTGMAAAELMLRGGQGILRTMPAASEEALGYLRRQAHALGISWSRQESYSDILAKLDHDAPETAAFLTKATRLFRGAQWVAFGFPGVEGADAELPEPVVHGALGQPYAHVTAPLRRLVDRFATEIALSIHNQQDVPAWVIDALPAISDSMKAGSRRANAVSRASIDAVESALLIPLVGESFVGVGLDDSTIQLDDSAIVARCTGQVRVGERFAVVLTSASLDKGPVFAASVGD